MDKQTELIKTSLSDAEVWNLDRDIVIKAVEEVKKHEMVGFQPEEYYDNNDLRQAMDEALSDPNFGHYYQAQEDLKEFSGNHPEEARIFGSVDTEEAMRELIARYKDNPLYKEYLKLSRDEALATLKLKTKMISAKILPITATYARLANIVFPETESK